jgi:hypothetical protein
VRSAHKRNSRPCCRAGKGYGIRVAESPHATSIGFLQRGHGVGTSLRHLERRLEAARTDRLRTLSCRSDRDAVTGG